MASWEVSGWPGPLTPCVHPSGPQSPHSINMAGLGAHSLSWRQPPLLRVSEYLPPEFGARLVVADTQRGLSSHRTLPLLDGAVPSPHWTAGGLVRGRVRGALRRVFYPGNMQPWGLIHCVRHQRVRTNALSFGGKHSRKTLKLKTVIIIPHLYSMKQGFRQILALSHGPLA